MAAPYDLHLPGGWSVRNTYGRTGLRLDVVDPDGVILTSLTSASERGLTIERAWRGLIQDGDLQWWALAVGRGEDDVPLTVTFTGPRVTNGPGYRRTKVPSRTVHRPTVVQGLWVTAVPGLQLVVTCRQGTREHVRHIEPLPGRWPAALNRVDGAAG